MPAVIKASEIRWASEIDVSFGFSRVEWTHARAIMRSRIAAAWPAIKRWKQCVYVIRVAGDVAIRYPKRFSPVVYVGEGNAYGRLYGHTGWLTSLVLAVPQVSIQVHIAEVVRRNRPNLYKAIEADLLKWFADRHGSLPWFNRQWEWKHQGQFEYTPDAWRSLAKRVGQGSGNRFLWAIQPTKNNDQYTPYTKGVVQT
jgi:hypothetical protein